MSAQDLTNQANQMNPSNQDVKSRDNFASEEEYESRFDLDNIIEREGISGLVRVSKEFYPNFKPYISWINDSNRHNVTQKYLYEKFDAICRFLNFESLFETTNPTLPDETPKQRFLRYEEFTDDLKRRNGLLNGAVDYNNGLMKKTKDNEVKEKIVLIDIMAFDYLIDISSLCHYLSLLEKTGWIRKAQNANGQLMEKQIIDGQRQTAQELNLDTFLDKLASEYAGHLKQFCNDEHLLKQGIVNLHNLVNSSFKETTSTYLRALERRCELTDKIIKHSIEPSQGEATQKPLPPSYFSSAILKSHETPFIVQWEQEKDFRRYNSVYFSSLIAGLVLGWYGIGYGLWHFSTNLLPHLVDTLSFPVAAGLAGAVHYVGLVLGCEWYHKIEKWGDELDQYYMSKNEPLIDKIISERKVFEGYNP